MPESGLADVQSGTDNRGVELCRAGISGLRLPLNLGDADKTSKSTIAEAEAWASVPASQRGAHMSRLAEALGELREGFDLAAWPEFIAKLRKRLEAPAAGAELAMPLFFERQTPKSGKPSWLDYRVRITGRQSAAESELGAEVKVPVKMVCPCSKEISEDGAHAQRAELSLEVQPRDWKMNLQSIEELATLAESCGSAPVDAVLKRADEKLRTEAGYGNARFAEDAVREAGAALAANKDWRHWRVHIVNFESIHNHQVFAEACSEQHC